jgi:hypothetical protein
MKGNLNHNLIKQIKDHIDLTRLKDIKNTIKSNVAITAAEIVYVEIEMINIKYYLLIIFIILILIPLHW